MRKTVRFRSVLSSVRNFSDHLAHAVFGFLSVLAVKVSPVIAGLCFAVFLSYEMDQEYRKDDWFDEEMREYGIGVAIGVVVMLCQWI